jgi:CBS-domain-containing membrane protein
MAEHGVRRLPVLDREGLLSGIVSLSDVCGGESRKKPWQVTFYKELPTAAGPCTRYHSRRSTSPRWTARMKPWRRLGGS